MPIDLTSAYRPLCRWCNDAGCIMCEGQRAEMQAQRTRLERAACYARERGLQQVNEQLLSLLADAIEYGAQVARQELPTHPHPAGTGSRFDKLEYRDDVRRKGQRE